MTNENLGEDKLEGLLATIASLDQDIRRVALVLPEPLMLAAERSIKQTKIGGGILDQLRRRHPNCPTTQALTLLEGVNKERAFKGDQAQSMYTLYDLVLRKQSVVKRARAPHSIQGSDGHLAFFACADVLCPAGRIGRAHCCGVFLLVTRPPT